MTGPTPAGAQRLACTRCGGALRVLQLAGHYGQTVEIDLCPPCHLVWFDTVEAARLAGPGLLDLIGAMAEAQTLPHHAGQDAPPCPRCQGPVRTVHNQTRWGRSLQLECQHKHGAWQTFAQFLAEKGLLRPLAPADRLLATRRDGTLRCVNCGGDVDARHPHCSWCGSVPALVDVARLARALDPEDATSGHAVHQTPTRKTALACAACGAAQPAAPAWQCVQCGATLAAAGLAEAHRAVRTLEPGLRAHARKPAPHVVQQRLATQEQSLQRERERVQRWQAEAEGREALPPWPGQPQERPTSLWEWMRWFQALETRAGLWVLALLGLGLLAWASFGRG